MGQASVSQPVGPLVESDRQLGGIWGCENNIILKCTWL